MHCIICKNKSVNIFNIIDNKVYLECPKCYVKFLHKKHYINFKSEKRHYLKHENYIHDKNYQKFLSRLYNPLKNKISKLDKGLDFGCGYCPTLAYMIKKDGFEVDIYDPYFFPNKEIFSKNYNFITCTEVAEHFHNPQKEFMLLNKLIFVSGWLGIMTCFYSKEICFKNWHYRRDPTHVVFYSAETFEFIAEELGWKCNIISKDIVLMQKN